MTHATVYGKMFTAVVRAAPYDWRTADPSAVLRAGDTVAHPERWTLRPARRPDATSWTPNPQPSVASLLRRSLGGAPTGRSA